LEEGIRCGGFSEYLISCIAEKKINININKLKINAVDDTFVPQGTVTELYRECNMLHDQICNQILCIMNKNET